MDDKSFRYHNNDLDFDLSNNLRHKIEAKKEGDISDVELSGNQIDISITGPNYSYEFSTSSKKKTLFKICNKCVLNT